MHKIHAEEWHWYPASTEAENQVVFDDETRLDIFTQVFYNVEGNQSDFTDYRLIRLDLPDHPEQQIAEKPKKKEKKSRQISQFPLNEPDRKEILEVANEAFEHVFERIEPENPELTRQLWNAEKYIEKEILRPEMLPIDWDYLRSLAEAFMMQHAVGLAVQADEQSGNS